MLIVRFTTAVCQLELMNLRLAFARAHISLESVPAKKSPLEAIALKIKIEKEDQDKALAILRQFHAANDFKAEWKEERPKPNPQQSGQQAAQWMRHPATVKQP